MAISPEDLQAIVGAIMETEPMRWVMAKMEEAKSPSAEPGAEPAPTDVPPAAPPPADAPPPAVPPTDEKEKDKMPYSKDAAEKDLAERYSKLHDETAQLRGEVEALKTAKRTTERTARLQTLRYSRAFDLAEEVERCSKMNDEGFNDHCNVIEKHYAKIETGSGLPNAGSYPPPEVEQYSRDEEAKVNKAVGWVKEERAAGRNPTITEAYRKFDVKL